ncbi:DUF5996 family protein [Flavobacterium hauense]
MKKHWPLLSYENGKATYETLQLYSQILGKIKLATLPWANHSWNVTLHIIPSGLTTQTMPYEEFNFQIDLDIINHELKVVTSKGDVRQFKLYNLTVADFYKKTFILLKELGIALEIMTTPSEIADPIPFELDIIHARYDIGQAADFHLALLAIQDVFMKFRGEFTGKASPIHFFWGGFDLALALFSGREAPTHPGKIPGLPNWVLQDAYSHELCDFGFWTGSEAFPEAAFYCYLYPEPEGYKTTEVSPPEAYYNHDLGEFILPYSAVQNSADPDTLLLTFLRSTYGIGANLANWDENLYKIERDFKATIE